MTVVLIGVIEEVVGGLGKCLHCCFHNSRLFHYLFSVQGEKSQSLCVYLYPNSSRGRVFVKDANGNRKKTRFDLPPWIMMNTFKILRTEYQLCSVQAAAEKRKQEERISKLSTEVKNMKKDLTSVKSDVQLILSYVKGSGGRKVGGF